MDQEPHADRQALANAGYTGPLGALLFSLLSAVIGALFGSVVFAMILGALVPDLTDTVETAVGTAVGALLGALIGFFKVRRGNLEALEHLEDKEWRRYIRRHDGS